MSFSCFTALSCLQTPAAERESGGSGGSAEGEISGKDSCDAGESEEDADENKEEEEKEEENEPLSLEWPETRRKQATYLFLLPIVFPLWLTLPDVRNPVSTNHAARHQGISFL